MEEMQFTQDEFDRWLRAPDLRRLQILTITRVRKDEATGEWREVRPRKPPEVKWTAIRSDNYGIALHLDGTVVVRAIRHPGAKSCEESGSEPWLPTYPLNMRIKPDGSVTHGLRALDRHQLAAFHRGVISETIKTLRAWARQSKARRMPEGPPRAMGRIKEIDAWIKEQRLDAKTYWIMARAGCFDA